MSKQKTVYPIELKKEICDKIASSTLGLRTICKLNKHFPGYDTVYSWLREDDTTFADMYARAKQQQVLYAMDEAYEIADNGKNDFYEDAEGKEHVDHENIHRSKLRIDIRKFMAIKLIPRIYGDVHKSEITLKLEDMTPEQKKKFFDNWPLVDQLKLVEEIMKKVEAEQANAKNN